MRSLLWRTLWALPRLPQGEGQAPHPCLPEGLCSQGLRLRIWAWPRNLLGTWQLLDFPEDGAPTLGWTLLHSQEPGISGEAIFRPYSWFLSQLLLCTCRNPGFILPTLWTNVANEQGWC